MEGPGKSAQPGVFQDLVDQDEKEGRDGQDTPERQKALVERVGLGVESFHAACPEPDVVPVTSF